MREEEKSIRMQVDAHIMRPSQWIVLHNNSWTKFVHPQTSRLGAPPVRAHVPKVVGRDGGEDEATAEPETELGADAL
jgi:hypothetical protein